MNIYNKGTVDISTTHNEKRSRKYMTLTGHIDYENSEKHAKWTIIQKSILNEHLYVKSERDGQHICDT